MNFVQPDGADRLEERFLIKPVIPRTYRATTEAWLGQLLLPVLFFYVLTITVINTSGLEPRVGGFGMLVLTVVAALDYMLPMLRNWLRTDGQRLEGLINGRYLHIYWNEVVAAWMVRRKRQHYLCLGTRHSTMVISLRFLDHDALWRQVCQRVPSGALGQESIGRIPEYKAWAAEREAMVNDQTPRVVVDHWLIQLFGWSAMMVFLFGAIVLFQGGQLVPALALLLLAVACGLVLLSWGLSEFSSQGIERTGLFGGRVMAWKDVQWIEIDPFNTMLVLVSENRRLVIPGPRLWSGPGKRAALELLLAQAEQRRIPVRRTFSVWFRLPKRTGVRR